MPASSALLGYGSRFEIVSDTSPDLYVELAEVKSITPGALEVDQVEVTHMQSPNRFREYVSGLVDAGEASFEMNFIPGSTSDDRIFELLNLGVGISRRRSMRINYPNGVSETFDGEITGYEPDVPFDDVMTAAVTVKISGPISRGLT
jgi:Lambda phage tail tube protein, TTP